jgi:hypothetical protein
MDVMPTFASQSANIDEIGNGFLLLGIVGITLFSIIIFRGI